MLDDVVPLDELECETPALTQQVLSSGKPISAGQKGSKRRQLKLGILPFERYIKSRLDLAGELEARTISEINAITSEACCIT
jgi:hypothetical protein